MAIVRFLKGGPRIEILNMSNVQSVAVERAKNRMVSKVVQTHRRFGSIDQRIGKTFG